MTASVLEITTEQFVDYITCPNLFYLKYISAIRPKTHVSVKSLLAAARDKLLYRILDGKYPDANK